MTGTSMKVFNKAVIFSALLACSGLMTHSAIAANVTGSPFSQQISDAFGGFTMSFGNNFINTDQHGTFDDIIGFGVGSSFEAGGSVSSDFTSTQSLTLASLKLVNYTFDINNNIVILSSLSASQLLPNYFRFHADNLSEGQYYLEITGSVNGSSGGAYGGSLNVTPLEAVPEPATYGMLLGGLGLLGYAARRKKTS